MPDETPETVETPKVYAYFIRKDGEGEQEVSESEYRTISEDPFPDDELPAHFGGAGVQGWKREVQQ